MPRTRSTNSMSTSGDQTSSKTTTCPRPRHQASWTRYIDTVTYDQACEAHSKTTVWVLAHWREAHCQTPFPNRSPGKCRESSSLTCDLGGSEMDLSRNWLIGVCRAMCSFSVEASWRKKTMQTKTLLSLVDRVLDLLKRIKFTVDEASGPR